MSEKLNLLVDGVRGVYVPRFFARTYAALYKLDPKDREVLEAGPYHEDYWECWDSVLDAAERKDDEGRTWHLEYNDCGDLLEVRNDFDWGDE